jgi:hypothetical protein
MAVFVTVEAGRELMVDEIFALSESIRYVAIYDGQTLQAKSRAGTEDVAGESLRYEEVLVNPTLLTLASRRGNLDSGGLRYLLVRFANFHQYVLPTPTGHVSVCIDNLADPVEIGSRLGALVNGR